MAQDLPDSALRGVPGVSEFPPPTELRMEIGNQEFMTSLPRLRELRSFLQKEAINIEDDEGHPLSFGGLNQLQLGYAGREPTLAEWTQLESLTQRLFGLLSTPLRRRFVLGDIPRWVSYL